MKPRRWSSLIPTVALNIRMGSLCSIQNISTNRNAEHYGASVRLYRAARLYSLTMLKQYFPLSRIQTRGWIGSTVVIS